MLSSKVGHSFSDILTLGSFLSNKSAFSQAEAFDACSRALGMHFLLLGAEQGVSLLLLTASFSILAYSSCFALDFLITFVFIFCSMEVFSTVNFSKCCYQELCHSLNALLLGNFLHPTIQHISFKLTFTQVPSAQVK